MIFMATVGALDGVHVSDGVCVASECVNASARGAAGQVSLGCPQTPLLLHATTAALAAALPPKALAMISNNLAT